MNDLMRQAYIVQILYHKTFLDVNEGFQYFTQHFDKAIDLWQSAYARTLLQEVQKFRKSLSAHQRADLVMEEARLFLREEKREMARSYYHQLLDEAEVDWVEAHKAEVFYSLGECYLAMAHLQDAFNSFNDALVLEREYNNQEKIADILNALGYISRRQGRFDLAVHYYQESIDIYKQLGKQPQYLRELANNLNSLGYVYCLLGMIDKALILCQAGLQIRERLSRNHEVAEVAVGLSHSTLGYIYLYDDNDINAESHFERALDLFKRTNNQRGLAMYHNRFGLLQMKRGKLNEALQHFQAAFKSAADIDEEVQITSLNRQGNIHCLLHACEEAKSKFEKAIALAQAIHDSYQEAEARIDLARALARLEEYELYDQELGRAAIIAEQQHYNKLLGEIERLQGDLAYQQKAYQDAFHHYAKLCHFMAQYNPIEYRRALLFLTDTLLELLKINNPVEVSNALEVLRNYWQEQQLESRFSEFLRVCDDIGEVNL